MTAFIATDLDITYAGPEAIYQVSGYFVKNDYRRWDVLAYLTSSAESARALCQKRNPSFEIESVSLRPE